MTCITEIETPCSKVYQANKHGNKHTILVILGKLVVNTVTNLSRCIVMLCHGTEQADYLSHEERSRNALTRHVADSKVQVILLHKVIVEVTTYLLCRSHRCKEIKALALKISGRNH